MHCDHQTRQCLICHSDLNDSVSLFHLLYQPKLCYKCIQAFEVIDLSFYFKKIKTRVLYHYNDFFKELLFQYKANYDYALKDAFLIPFVDLKQLYHHHLIAVVPSSNQDNQKRGFCPNEAIVKNLGDNVFTGLYKRSDYKQTSQKDRSLVAKEIRIKDGYLLTNQKVLLFDDVLTSGNTINTCIELIKQYHPKSIEVLILSSNQINNFLDK